MRLPLLLALGLVAPHVFAQAPDTLEGVFTVGAAVPLGAWSDQVQGSVQAGIGGRYHLGAISLGAELFIAQGHSKRLASSGEDGDLSTVGLVPQLFVPLYTGSQWQGYALVGVGLAHVWATDGYRTDLVPTADGPQASTYGGSTTWHTTRPVGMAGVGLLRHSKAGRRIGLEARWQRVATPGIRSDTLSTCLVLTW